ncbi:MAG: DUF4121 family protein [Oscillospiraceae bacterium]
MYTIGTLKEINQQYDHNHGLTQSDVNMANTYVDVIQRSRTDNQIQVGDIVELTTKHGDYYKKAHIESYNAETSSWSVCQEAYTPFVIFNSGKTNIICNTSGGAWSGVPNKLTLIGKRLKLFCDWGNCGACGNGAVNFQAEVNVWEYSEPNRLYGEFSTKDFNKKYISYCVDEHGQPKDGSQYRYLGDGIAFTNRNEYEAWLKTYKGVEFKGNWENQTVVFLYKENSHLISEVDWDNLNLPVDSRMCNGTILVKVKYDDEQHVIETYRFTNDGSKYRGVYQVYM